LNATYEKVVFLRQRSVSGVESTQDKKDPHPPGRYIDFLTVVVTAAGKTNL